MPITTKLLFSIVFGIAALGPLPRLIPVGGTTLSGLLTAAVAIACMLAFFTHFRSSKSVLMAGSCLALLFALSLRPILGGYNKDSVELEVFAVIMLGSFFLLFHAAPHPKKTSNYYTSLQKIIFFSSIAHLIFLLPYSLTYRHGPAFALTSIVFFAFHFSKYKSGSKFSAVYLTLCIICHVLLESRIVLLAEAFIVISNKSSLSRPSQFLHDAFRKPTSIFFGTFFSILTISLLAYFLSEKFIGGDQGLDIFGTPINTSGRVDMWALVLAPWLDSPWLGHGTPGPQQMLDTPGWTHPHNDYLRLLHQFGIIGLASWLLFIKISLLKTRKNKISSTHALNNKLTLETSRHSITMLCICMLTDNPIVYSYVMYPIIALIAASTLRSPKLANSLRNKSSIETPTGVGHAKSTPRS